MAHWDYAYLIISLENVLPQRPRTPNPKPRFLDYAYPSGSPPAYEEEKEAMAQRNAAERVKREQQQEQERLERIGQESGGRIVFSTDPDTIDDIPPGTYHQAVETLNEEGWELVTAAPWHTNSVLIFRRERRE